MKKLMAILAMATLLALGSVGGEPVTAISQTGCVPAPDGLVSWWPGDGNADDIIGANDGTLQSGATFATGFVTSGNGLAFSFDGVDDSVDIPDLLDGATQASFEAWIKTSGSSSIQQIISRNTGFGGIYGFALTSDFKLDFAVFVPGECHSTSSQSLSLDTWYHVVATWDGTTSKVYINGVEANSSSCSGTLRTTADDAFIGAQNFPGFPRIFNGKIDEVAIYNRALSASEIQAIFNAGSAGKCKVLEVPVDLKPGSCPNPLNVKSQGVLPVAIAGTAGFNVTDVDPASVRLEGVAPLRSSLDDVATPLEPFTGKEDCASDCTDAGADGLQDLSLKFDRQEVLAALGAVSDGDCLVLQLTGNLFDGTDLVGEDVVIIKKKGK